MSKWNIPRKTSLIVFGAALVLAATAGWWSLGGQSVAVIRAGEGTLDEFVRICDRFTNKKLFMKDARGNLVKDKFGNLTKIKYPVE